MGSPQEPPLTPDERARAAGLAVWTVWYADQFSPDGDSFPLAICLSEREGRAEVARRVASGSSKLLAPGWDGIELAGPRPLHEGGWVACGVDVVREVLRRAAAGEPGPVLVPIPSP